MEKTTEHSKYYVRFHVLVNIRINSMWEVHLVGFLRVNYAKQLSDLIFPFHAIQNPKQSQKGESKIANNKVWITA